MQRRVRGKQGEPPVPKDLVNADFSRRVVLDIDALPWLASPQAGVERRMLDRVGGEVARATSVVRYAARSAFPEHEHTLGEEFLVLSGVFSDEHGDYPAGTYIRNPPGSRHSPRSAPGCMIFVKLRQMRAGERGRVVIDTGAASWQSGDAEGHERIGLYSADETGERVKMERLKSGSRLPTYDCPGGEELLLLAGDLADEAGMHSAPSWIRSPPGSRRSLRSETGALYWVKRGHLAPA
jgi:anti-sigma factor ChrR (cupin superfamily)